MWAKLTQSERETGPQPRDNNRYRLSGLKYWEIIADNLKKRGWSLGWVSVLDCEGRTTWIADAHRDGKRYVVHADEKLTAFLELESAIRACGELVWQVGGGFAKLGVAKPILKFREVEGARRFFLPARPYFHTERRLGGGRSTGKSSRTISAKPVGAWAGSQRLIPRGEQSGLLTRIAATESVTLCVRMKSWQRFWNLKESRVNHSASWDARTSFGVSFESDKKSES
jgi:hypothetical protein